MSRKNIILLVSLLVLISLSVALYLYIENKNLAKNTEQKNAEQNAVITELNSFKRDSADIKTEQEIVKELNSFKAPNTTTNTINTTNTTINNNPPNTATATPVKPKPKTEVEVIQELNSFKAPPKN